MLFAQPTHINGATFWSSETRGEKSGNWVIYRVVSAGLRALSIHTDRPWYIVDRDVY
jgi:hypothetical protein